MKATKIFVSGGASGLGEAIVRALAADPDRKICFSYCRSKEAADALTAELPNACAIQCNFAEPASVDALVAALAEFEPQGIVNNALPALTKNHFHKLDPADIANNFQANVLPVIRIMQAVLRGLRKRKFGKIVTILSTETVSRPSIGWSVYSAEKAYLRSLAKSWAVENANFNITSNCVSPSFMQTSLTSDIDERLIEGMVNANPLRRLLEPAEVAQVVTSLIDATQHINGVNLPIGEMTQ